MVGCLALSLPQRIQGQEQPEEITITKDLTFLLELLSPVSTATNQKGDSFSCKVLKPDEFAGAIVSGHIRKLKRSGKANKKSEIDLGFDSITLPNGRSGGFNAQVQEVSEVAGAGNDGRADSEGTVKAKSRVKVTVKRAVAGALVGGIIGGLLGGAQGAAAGAAIGASVGVSTVLATDGPDLEFKQGTQFTVLTNDPVRRRNRAPAQPEVAQTSPPPAPAPGMVAAQPAPGDGGNSSTQQEVASATAPPATLPVLKPAPPASPHLPSKRVREYINANLYRLSIPANWRESSNTNPVTFAPEGGYFLHQDQFVLTHGMMVGIIHLEKIDLRQASEKYVGTLLQGHSYLSQQNIYQDGQLAGHQSLSVPLAGKSTVTERPEVVNVYTTMLRNGDMFYVVAVAPKDEYPAYRDVFQAVLRSIQISD